MGGSRSAAPTVGHAVEVVQVTKHFGPVAALDGVELTVEPGELMAVLGPSGSGKTTLLRTMAGFERLEQGRITLRGKVVALPGVHLPPHRRQVAVVPQDGALFPHLSVVDNVGFGLDRAERRSGRVQECLALVGLGGLEERMPHELSGGQQQRVAVARALAPRPPLVLLDEPFSALDASLRAELRRDVRAALREDGATALLVTHDQSEALSMADRVAVMRDGRILQVGTPTEVYRRPADAWVAHFVGDAMLLPVTGPGPGGTRSCSLGPVRLAPTSLDLHGPLLILVRPEQVRVARAPRDGPHPTVPAWVERVAYHGHDALVSLHLGDGSPALFRVPDGPQAAVAAGEVVHLWVEGEVQAYARQEPEAGTYRLD